MGRGKTLRDQLAYCGLARQSRRRDVERAAFGAITAGFVKLMPGKPEYEEDVAHR
jgi:hypothetical protein